MHRVLKLATLARSVAAAALAVAVLAAGCASDEPAIPAAAPTTTAATAAPSTVAPDEAPATTEADPSQPGPDSDGQPLNEIAAPATTTSDASAVDGTELDAADSDGTESDASVTQPATTLPEAEATTAPGPEPAPTTTAPEPEPAPTTSTAPTVTTAPTTTVAPEPEPAPTTTVAPEPEPAPTTTVAPEPEVFCADGLVFMAEYATATDDGCRYEVCDNGRTSDGWCRGPDYVEVENPGDDPGEPAEPSTDPNDHPCQRQDDAADGLLGICTHRGVRYCFDHEWLVCPGGGGEPCPAVSGPLAFSGRGGLNTVRNLVPITAGWWRADICLWDSPYGASLFAVGLYDAEGWAVAQVNSEWSNILEVRGPESGEVGVGAGRWTIEFEAVGVYRPVEVFVTAAAGGEWTVVFTRLEDDSDTG